MVLKGSGMVTEEHRGRFSEAGYDVRLLRAKHRKTGGAIVLLKGGLGDPHSQSVVGLAKALLEVSDGELMAATVSTTRPKKIAKALAGVSRSRKHQSQSVYGASNYVNDKYHPNALFLAGQSRGSVSVVDGALYLVNHPKKNPASPKLGVATIDGPGIFEDLDYEGNVLQGLARLGMHSLEDIRKLGVIDRAKLFGRMATKISLYEAPYFFNDISYLRRIGIYNEIEELRSSGLPVTHIFHRDDIVPGAEVDSEHSVVLEGGHVRFLREPHPVAEVIYARAQALL